MEQSLMNSTPYSLQSSPGQSIDYDKLWSLGHKFIALTPRTTEGSVFAANLSGPAVVTATHVYTVDLPLQPKRAQFWQTRHRSQLGLDPSSSLAREYVEVGGVGIEISALGAHGIARETPRAKHG